MLFNTYQLTKNRKDYLLSDQLYRDVFDLTREEKAFDLFTDDELIAAAGSTLVFDVECYVNYFVVSFRSVESKKVVVFEQSPDSDYDRRKLSWVLHNFCIVGFNSKGYDLPICSLALIGAGTAELKEATNDIILYSLHGKEFEKKYCRVLQVNHIDLIEVAPLQASLKLYAGRLHAPRMQEVDIDPNAALTQHQARIVRLYNINDLDNTIILFKELEAQIKLREQMSLEYKQDLRSRSDAQIAECVIGSELARVKGYFPKKPTIAAGTKFRYQVPSFVKYQTPVLQKMLEIVRSAEFVVSETGSVEMPKELAELNLTIGKGVYRMGIGGLHSSEQCVAHHADENTLLVDRDVASYYPSIILTQELYPKHLGKAFLEVYRGIVNRRLEAKRTAPKGVVEQSLKITINGSFGKLGNKYSVLYSPDLLIQVTVGGQLALLLLIEMLECAGIPVVSANTDGVVIKCPKDKYTFLQTWIIYWQQVSGFETEETQYKAIYSRDVNNYIAIGVDGKAKVKGTYAERGSSQNSVLSKNPESLICNDAVIKFLTKNVSIEQTVRECSDIRRFVTIRNVKGGAEKSGVYLGKSIRWYFSTSIKGEINYRLNGNKVPNTDNAMPLMDLPKEMPSDVDYDYYIQKANSILHDIGYYANDTAQLKGLFD